MKSVIRKTYLGFNCCPILVHNSKILRVYRENKDVQNLTPDWIIRHHIELHRESVGQYMSM